MKFINNSETQTFPLTSKVGCETLMIYKMISMDNIFDTDGWQWPVLVENYDLQRNSCSGPHEAVTSGASVETYPRRASFTMLDMEVSLQGAGYHGHLERILSEQLTQGTVPRP